MRCGMFVNDKGDIVLIHDKNIPDNVLWLEYDQPLGEFSIVHDNGMTQPVGFPLDSNIVKQLSHGDTIKLCHLINKKIVSQKKVTFIYKEV